MTVDFNAFILACDKAEVVDGNLTVHFDGDCLTAHQLHIITSGIVGFTATEPDEVDDKHVAAWTTPRQARDIALAIKGTFSPAERYHTGISIEYDAGELDASIVLVPEVTAGEGRAGA